MKNSIIAFALMVVASAELQAASITVTNRLAATLESTWITDNAGLFIANGAGVVAIGSFSDEADIGTAATAAALLSDFNQFGGSVSVSGVGTVSGLYANSITASVSDGGFVDQAIYTVIGNAASLSSSCAFVVFRHDAVFPADADNPTATVNAIVSHGSGDLLRGGTSTGDFNGNAVNTFTLARYLGIPCVPEPSAGVLGLLGMGFLAFRRRRQLLLGGVDEG